MSLGSPPSIGQARRILNVPVSPWRYLRDVLERLPTHPAQRLEELLPDRWAAAQRAATDPAPPRQTENP
jgi:hypothetical protein